MRTGKLKLNLYIDEDVKREFADICRVAGVSQTSVVEEFLIGYVEFMKNVKGVKQIQELDKVFQDQMQQVKCEYSNAVSKIVASQK